MLFRSARQMLMGSPAKHVRDISDQDMQWKRMNTREYQDLTVRCRQSLVETTP